MEAPCDRFLASLVNGDLRFAAEIRHHAAIKMAETKYQGQ